MNDIKQAMRDKDKLTLGVLQLLKAKIDNYEKETGHDGYKPKYFQAAVASELKQLGQSMKFAQDASRVDLIDEIRDKESVLLAYLPKQMTQVEVEDVVMKHIDTSKPVGYNMKFFMDYFKGTADNKTISEVVRSYYPRGGAK